MKKITLLAVLPFVGLLAFGVASCVNPIGVGNGGGGSDTTVHRRGGDSLRDTLHLPPDSLRLPPDSLRHHHHDDNDSLNGGDTLWHHGGGLGDTTHLPPPDTNDGGLDSTFIDSLLHHH